MRIALFVLAASLALGACTPQNAKVIVTAPKTNLRVGDTVRLTATLPRHKALDSLRRNYLQEYIWNLQKPQSGFVLGLLNGDLTATRPDTAIVCARLWFSYKPDTNGLKTDMIHTSLDDGCIRVVSGPAK